MTLLNSRSKKVCPSLFFTDTDSAMSKKVLMAEKKDSTDRTSTFNSDSTQNPPPKPTKLNEEEEEEEEEESQTGPEPKRLKTCPTTTTTEEKVQELSTPSIANFSFTFDTQFASRSPDSTPKFGSFSFAVTDSVKLIKEAAASAAQEQKVSGDVGEFEKD